MIEQAAQCGNCCKSAEFSSTAFGVTKYGNASGMDRISSICDCEITQFDQDVLMYKDPRSNKW